MWKVSAGYNAGMYVIQRAAANHGVLVSAMYKANLQGMVYYIKHFRMILHTCKHSNVELNKFQVLCHQRDMEEYHKEPEFILIVDTKECPKTLETVEDYIRGF